jgi:large subunit ribosomal protein L35
MSRPARLEGMPGRLANLCHKDNEMPKMKTKSSCKKRFSMTATGKVRASQAGKQHGMIKRTNKQIRNQRGTMILTKGDANIVRGFMPYSR